MNLLLDTHTFLWTVFDTSRLSDPAKSAIMDTANEVHVSSVSFWEISLKHSLGKITLEGIEPDELPTVAQRMGLSLVPLDAVTAASSHRLARSGHKDPFDRLLIWQAIRGGFHLVSADTEFGAYRRLGLQVLW